MTERLCCARVVYDYPRDELIGTVLATGATFVTSDPKQMAEWLFAAGVRHDQVFMPDTGDKIALHHRLMQLGREESGK